MFFTYVLYILAWLGMAAIAILNGVIREAVYRKFMGELKAHQISTLTGSVAIGIYIWTLMYFLPLQFATQALAIGVIWLLMTIAFEFGFGHYVMQHPWTKLLADYNLRRGRVWPLFLLWLTVAPLVMFSFA
ncbi:hypothetical protein Pse7367_1525 [Thalassoporum mexicanum PCC 7367]|uniref:hypothetical protein n=1 Tax=Thalassoporum mexicanum TaxID=3457544 RepID=UPI00029FB43D|nr:hypothetical protein [Pseudanabaena sp. PCC 7367]AFY69814.1 hypothetical protein Pse7367_1525 [Pseudanabaena sp. PCC 7367]